MRMVADRQQTSRQRHADRDRSGAGLTTLDVLNAGTAPPSLEVPGDRQLCDEVPVALVYDDVTLAVMMATPQDLVDFAVGFTLTEGVSAVPSDVEIRQHRHGIECRLTLTTTERQALANRQRAMMGPSACGLCGVRSLAQAIRLPASVGGLDLRITPDDVSAATDALRDHQPLHDRTHAAHAAGLFVPGRGLLLVREDVGRHNALDKLAGGLIREGESARAGAVVLTSRVSIEMVQKAAAIGAPAIIAVSSPTSLAVRMARAAGLTLISNARDAQFETHTHPFRCPDRAALARPADPCTPN